MNIVSSGLLANNLKRVCWLPVYKLAKWDRSRNVKFHFISRMRMHTQSLSQFVNAWLSSASPINITRFFPRSIRNRSYLQPPVNDMQILNLNILQWWINYEKSTIFELRVISSASFLNVTLNSYKPIHPFYAPNALELPWYWIFQNLEIHVLL